MDNAAIYDQTVIAAREYSINGAIKMGHRANIDICKYNVIGFAIFSTANDIKQKRQVSFYPEYLDIFGRALKRESAVKKLRCIAFISGKNRRKKFQTHAGGLSFPSRAVHCGIAYILRPVTSPSHLVGVADMNIPPQLQIFYWLDEEVGSLLTHFLEIDVVANTMHKSIMH